MPKDTTVSTFRSLTILQYLLFCLLFLSFTSKRIVLAMTSGGAIISSQSYMDDNPMHPHNQSQKDNSECRESNTIQFVFSDIDGTLVHYQPTAQQDKESLLFLPPSATGLQAHISIKTLHQCQQVRKRALLILVSGMRTKTLFQRIPFLPRADVYVSENGGRIFYPIQDATSSSSNKEELQSPILLHVRPIHLDGMSPEDMQEFGIVEDLDWKRMIRQQPLQSQEEDPPSPVKVEDSLELSAEPLTTDDDRLKDDELLSSLQMVVMILEQRNFTIDHFGYSTCIRVNWKQQRHDIVTRKDFDQIHSSIDLNRLGLQCSFNLGCIDFFPLTSGKKNCCEYIAKKFYDEKRKKHHHQDPTLTGNEILASSSLCICDDDNDVPLAMACRKAFLPTISSNSIQKLVDLRGEDRMVVTEDIPKSIIGYLATEEALRRVLNEL